MTRMIAMHSITTTIRGGARTRNTEGGGVLTVNEEYARTADETYTTTKTKLLEPPCNARAADATG